MELLIMLRSFLYSYGPDIQAACNPKKRQTNYWVRNRKQGRPTNYSHGAFRVCQYAGNDFGNEHGLSLEGMHTKLEN